MHSHLKQWGQELVQTLKLLLQPEAPEAAPCNPPSRHSGPNSLASMAALGAVGVKQNHQGRRRALVASASTWRDALPRLLNPI